jgi:hypothetical protein
MEVFLFAPDQQEEILQAPYCGGLEGAHRYTGSYRLVSVRHERALSELALPDHFYFVAGYTHGGLHAVKLLERLGGFALYQYGSCNTEDIYLFQVDVSGAIRGVRFLQRDGRVKDSQMTGPGGEFRPSLQTGFFFCHYDNWIGGGLCDAYNFNGSDFLQAASWMRAAWPTPPAQAERALYEFLLALHRGKFEAASYYLLDAKNPRDREQKAQELELRCTGARHKCLVPDRVVCEGEAGSPNVFRVTATFHEPGNGEHPEATFHVKLTADWWKVVDLPPTAP